GTREILDAPRANRIVLSGPQDRPRGSVRPSAIFCAGPPLAGILLSLLSEKKAIHCPSGDQNGYSASSFPAIVWAKSSANGRSHNMGFAPGNEAANTIARPSGESSNCGAGIVMFVAMEKVTLSGGKIEKRTSSLAGGGAGRYQTASDIRMIKAAIQALRF